MIFFWMCAGLGLLAICIAATIAIIKLTPRMRLPRPPRPRREPPRHEWSYSSMEMKTVRSSGDRKVSIKNGVVRYKDEQGRTYDGPIDDAPAYVTQAIKDMKKTHRDMNTKMRDMFDSFDDFFKED